MSKEPRRGSQRGESGQKSQEGAVKEARVVKIAKKGRSKRREWSKEPRRGGQRGENGSKSKVGAVKEAREVKRAKKGRSER